MIDQDKMGEECGIFGFFSNNSTNEAAALTALGLHALQHRGQEAAGIVSSDGEDLYIQQRDGLVSDHFNKQPLLNTLQGGSAIGHVRYSTAGSKYATRNYQPILAEFSFGKLAVAHNGNLTNATAIRKQLTESGSIFQSTMDTEIIIHLIATSQKSTIEDKIVDALNSVEGAYCLLILTKDKMIAIRDSRGVRPLMLGKMANGEMVIASESCALDIIGAKPIRDVAAGEMVIIDQDGMESIFPFAAKAPKFCIFEYVYFARPDSRIEGKNVYEMRKNIGRILASEAKIDADLVVPVPDSGVPAALGYAMSSGIAFELGIIRNHYVGRTFIEPTDQIRNFGVKLKHNPNTDLLQGKRVILVDDSIVRGTTSKKIVQMVREAGASEVHLCIASPPTTNPCFYGIDTPDKDKLLAAQHSIDEMRDLIGADSLSFISLEGLYQAIASAKRNDKEPQYCDACFSGEYPISPNGIPSKPIA